MKMIRESVGGVELSEIAGRFFAGMVKGVVDIERRILAVDAELHSDLEALLLKDGSLQKDLWGINLYPDASDNSFLEFDSMINIRPSQGNRSRGVDDPNIQETIRRIVSERVKR